MVVPWTKNRQEYGPLRRIRRPADQSPTGSQATASSNTRTEQQPQACPNHNTMDVTRAPTRMHMVAFGPLLRRASIVPTTTLTASHPQMVSAAGMNGSIIFPAHSLFAVEIPARSRTEPKPRFPFRRILPACLPTATMDSEIRRNRTKRAGPCRRAGGYDSTLSLALSPQLPGPVTESVRTSRTRT